MSEQTRNRLAVPADRLRKTCDPSTAVPKADASTIIGQKEALAAVRLGLEMVGDGYANSHYNIMVVGQANTGRTAKTVEFVRQYAAQVARPPQDTICLFDADNFRRPTLAHVPCGAGKQIKQRLEQLFELGANDLRQRVALVRQQRLKDLHDNAEKVWQAASDQMLPLGYIVVETDDGLFLTTRSIKSPDEPMSKEEHDALPEEVRDKLDERLEENQERVRAMMDQVVIQIKALHAALEAQSDEPVSETMKQILAEETESIRALAGDSAVFLAHLDKLEQLIIDFVMKEPEESGPGGPVMMMMGSGMVMGQGPKQPDPDQLVLASMCQVNVLVDNPPSEHPPVVHVELPQFSELFGRLNPQVNGESLSLDHTMVESGAFLRAHGGYLILDLEDLLRWGGGISFYKLLSVIRTGKLKIEGKSQFVDAMTMIDYQTKEIDLDVRVIVVCNPRLAHLLRHFEPEFDNLFRINAEFDTMMAYEPSPSAYAAFVELCRASGDLPEFTPEAVSRLVEYGIRRTEDQTKASTEFGLIKDIITEAAHWARQSGCDQVAAEHVDQAIKARFDRQALLIRHYQEQLDRGFMLLQHEGATVGQVNALAVLAWNDEVRFGVPSRITARAFAGESKLVLVQRETDQSGPSSNTAVAVIRGWLSGQYGREEPLSLAVQLCFEQNYGGVDGDSASLAETVAAISAISELPIDQRLAITGSMNQWGEAQPIGGVNDKLEGHFQALKRRGLLKKGGGHGAIVPIQNLDNLMLDPELVQAQRDGLYQVYFVTNIDEALELLLDRPAEEIHRLVRQKLGLDKKPPWYQRLWRKLFGNGDQSANSKPAQRLPETPDNVRW